MSDTDNVLPAGAVPLAGDLPLAQSTPAVQAVAFVPTPPLTLVLPDGREIRMERPTMSLSNNIVGVLGMSQISATAYEMERMRVRALLYISSIDGQAEQKISDPISRAALEQKIGDEWLEVVMNHWANHFGHGDASIVALVKKS